jgi:hypothetical protein
MDRVPWRGFFGRIPWRGAPGYDPLDGSLARRYIFLGSRALPGCHPIIDSSLALVFYVR